MENKKKFKLFDMNRDGKGVEDFEYSYCVVDNKTSLERSAQQNAVN